MEEDKLINEKNGLLTVNYDFIDKLNAINTREFSRVGQAFEKYGYYTDAPEGTKDYEDFWDLEEERCLNGYSVGGIRITGPHYHYLNYFPILKSIDDKNLRIKRKQSGLPRFLDMDFLFYHVFEEALLRKKGLAVAKARRKGFSYKSAQLMTHKYYFYPDSRCIIGAFENSYAQATMDMCLHAVNNIDENTAWTKRRGKIDRMNHIRASYLEKSGSNYIEKGYKSEIFTLTFKDNPNASIGKSADIFGFEEAGKWPSLLEAYMKTIDTLKDGDEFIGIPIIWGTGGGMDKNSIDFSKMFYSPENYDLLAFDNSWDEGSSGTTCSYFVPASWYRPPYVDDNGISNIEDATNNIISKYNRIKNDPKSTQKELTTYLSQQPLTPRQAFLVPSGNIFPVAELQDLSARLQSDKSFNLGTRVALYRDKTDIVQYRVNKHLKEALYPYNAQAKEGCVVIYEHPVPIENRTEKSLYKAGTDPYAFDHATESDSLAATYIYKEFDPNTLSGNYIVASYVGRPETLDDYYDTLTMLLEYYNCKTLYENNYKDLKTYLEYRGKLGLLLKQPDNVIKDTVKVSNVSRGYGIHMTETIKTRGVGLLKDWLLEENEMGEKNLYTLRDLNLINELIAYNKKGNFDRVIAMILIMFYREHDKLNRKKQEADVVTTSMWDSFHSKFLA